MYDFIYMFDLKVTNTLKMVDLNFHSGFLKYSCFHVYKKGRLLTLSLM